MDSETRDKKEAILGGELRNAWEPAEKGRDRYAGVDMRPVKAGGTWSLKTERYYENFDRIFGRNGHGADQQKEDRADAQGSV